MAKSDLPDFIIITGQDTAFNVAHIAAVFWCGPQLIVETAGGGVHEFTMETPCQVQLVVEELCGHYSDS